MVLAEPSEKENKLRDELQEAVRVELKKRGWDATELAEKLGLLPAGAELLLDRRQWPLETAFRVADALGIQFLVEVAGAGG